ncbi:MAG: AI-2E family transporter [Burkholderiales bacterium]|nr:AI-2E family transporter [Bacteroidia bacterium]
MEETKPVFNFNKSIFTIIIILFGLLLLFSLKEYFTAFLGSIIFYVLFKGWMHKLVNEKKWKKSYAAILINLVSFFIILLPITFFVSMVYNKVIPVASNPDALMPYVHQMDSTLQHKYGIKIMTVKNIDMVKAESTKVFSGALNQGLAFFSSIVMLYFFLYFMLINFNRMEASIILSLPFKKSKIKMFGEELKAQTFSNAIGIPLIAVVQGFFAYFIYLMTGVPEAGFWAILTGFASIIPIVGTGIIWLPVCIYLFITGHTMQGFIVVAWSVVIMGSMDNVIRFLLAKRMADVHPVVTVLGIILGLEYLGITGLIFGPLLISYFMILLKIYYADYHNLTPEIKTKENVLEMGLPLVYSKRFIDKYFIKKEMKD